MNKLQSNRRGIHQAQRALQRVKKLREQVVRSTQAFLARREQRLAWWQRAFRAPAVSQRWLFSQASSLWAAFMSLLGLAASPGRKSKLVHARTSNPSRDNRYVRAGAGRLVYESLESRQLLAGLPELIELAFDSRSISQIAAVGSDVFFVTQTQDKGTELWKVDSGSATGATIVKDILPGSSSSNPHSLTNVNGSLFFSANDGISGAELWVLHPEDAESLDASLIGGDLVITDTDVVGKNNQFTISRTGNILSITDANEQFTAAPLGGTLSPDNKTLSFDVTVTPITTLTLNGALGNDTVTVDLSTGNPIPSGGLTFNGGSQTSGPGDKLVITGGTTTSQTFNFTNEHDGSVVLADAIAGTINYTGLEPVSSTVNAADVILKYSTVTEVITVTLDAADTTLTKVDSDVGGESVSFTNPSNSLQINGGDIGNDTINVTSFGTSGGGFKASLTIDGGTGTDWPDEIAANS